jgi:hypothetical protein
MIEDKELELKLAESPEEAYWTKLKEQTIKTIESLKHEIIINECILKLADEKLAEK